MKTILKLMAISVVSLVAGCQSKATTSWESDACELFTSPTFTITDGTPTPQWMACRAMYLAATDYVPASFMFQLMTPGTYGTYVEPGRGWLTVTISNVDEAPMTLDVVSSTVGTPEATVAEVLYTPTTPEQPGGKFPSGRLEFSTRIIDPYGDDDESGFSIMADISVSAQTAAASVYIDGGIGVWGSHSIPTETPDDPGDEPGGCSFQARCTSYSSQCSSGAPSMAPCYCAAACLCACANDTSCEQQNSRAAHDLGTSCSYRTE